MNTTIVDRLFLELSQFTNARTKRELTAEADAKVTKEIIADNERLTAKIKQQKQTITDLDISFHNLQPDTWKVYHRLKAEKKWLEEQIENWAKSIEETLNCMDAANTVGLVIVLSQMQALKEK